LSFLPTGGGNWGSKAKIGEKFEGRVEKKSEGGNSQGDGVAFHRFGGEVEKKEINPADTDLLEWWATRSGLGEG